MKIIVITGGSASGKTTLSNLLSAQLRCPVITEDDYYRDNAAEPNFDPARFDFDALTSRDHTLLVDHLKTLKGGHAIDKPFYCFKTHSRLEQTERFMPSAYLILEGLHLLCEEKLRQLFDYSIFIDVPDDVRLARRLRRDVQERQRTVDGVIDQYLSYVRPAHLRLIAPSQQHADLILRPSLEGEPQTVLLKPVLDALRQAKLY